MPLQLIIAAWLAAGARASATLCAAFPGACDGSFAGGAIVVDGNATIGGTIPTELGQLPGLQEVRLLRCRLSGTVPSEVGRLTALRTLEVTLVAARGVASWRGRHDAADQAELALTVVFSLLLAFGWGVITSVVSKTALALQAGQRAAQFEATLDDLSLIHI